MRNFFTHRKITDRIYNITESYADGRGFTLALIIGDERAALIDSGLGAVDGLRSYVETLTDKPVICLVTHGHPDHAGAAVLFDKAYMNPKDDESLSWALARERRLGDLVMFSDNNKEVLDYAAEHCVDCTGFKYEPLAEGDTFNLGGVSVYAVAMPGHTEGSVAFVCPEENYIHLGDAIADRLMLTDEARNEISACRDGAANMLKILESMPGALVYRAHSADTVEKSMIADTVACCNELLEGKTENDPVAHFHFAELTHPGIKLRLHSFGSVGIVYNILAVK